MTFESIVELLVAGFYAYAAAGFAFALAFVIRGVPRIDEQARGASLLFRLILLPGTVALWPWLLKRWLITANRSGEAK